MTDDNSLEHGSLGDVFGKLGVIEKRQGEILAGARDRDQAERARVEDILRRYYLDYMVSPSEGLFVRHFPKVIREELTEIMDNGHPMSRLKTVDSITRKRLQRRLSELSPDQVIRSYFGLHSDAYLAALDKNILQIDPETRKGLCQKKIIVNIPARNEVDLLQAVDSLSKSYGPDFIREVGIIVYHNHLEEIHFLPQDVQDGISALQEYPNLVVIDEQLTSGMKLPEVKKRSVDYALRLTQENPDQLLVLVDADLTYASPESIQIAAAALSSSEMPFVALSTFQRPSAKVSDKFPLYAFKKGLDEAVYRHLVLENERPFTYLGSFGVMSKKTYTGVGGYIPEEIHEDMRFDNQIRLANLGYYSDDECLIPGTFSLNIVTEFNPDRDLSAAFERQHRSRFDPSYYYLRSGSRRLDWKYIPQSSDPLDLLSGDLTPAGIARLVQQHLDSVSAKNLDYRQKVQKAIDKYLMQIDES